MPKLFSWIRGVINMLSAEQLVRLEELRAKEGLSEEELHELEQLEMENRGAVEEDMVEPAEEEPAKPLEESVPDAETKVEE